MVLQGVKLYVIIEGGVTMYKKSQSKANKEHVIAQV